MVRPTEPQSATKKKPAGGRRITRELVALSSAAVLAVYAVGYARTGPAYSQLTAQESRVAPARTTAPPSAAVPSPTRAPAAVVATPSTSVSSLPASGAEADDTEQLPSSPGSSHPGGASAALPIPTSTAPSAAATATNAPTPPPTPTAAPPSPTATAAATSTYKDGTYVGFGSGRHGSIQATVVIKAGKIVTANISRCGTRYPCSDIASLPGAVISQQSTNVDTVSGATDSSNSYLDAVDQALQKAAGQA